MSPSVSFSFRTVFPYLPVSLCLRRATLLFLPLPTSFYLSLLVCLPTVSVCLSVSALCVCFPPSQCMTTLASSLFVTICIFLFSPGFCLSPCVTPSLALSLSISVSDVYAALRPLHLSPPPPSLPTPSISPRRLHLPTPLPSLPLSLSRHPQPNC